FSSPNIAESSRHIVESSRRDVDKGGGARPTRSEESVSQVRSSGAAAGWHAWTVDRGWGKIGAVDGPQVRVDYFESPALPVAESIWVAQDSVKISPLPRQTRVYWEEAGHWYAGRVIGGDAEYGYAVQKPNLYYHQRVPSAELWVRWARPVDDP